MKDSIRILLHTYQVRKTKQQKKEFRNWLQEYLTTLGYKPDYQVYKKNEAGVNIIVGDVEKAKIVLSAHYDTPPNFFFPVYMFVSGWIRYIVSEWIGFIPVLLIAKCISMLVEVITNTVEFASISFNITLSVLSFYILFGIANKHTANDNTSGVATLLSLLEKLPQNERENVAFVFFDQEELGLLGSRAFKKKYRKEMEGKPLINFDCVGDGDNLFFISNWNFLHANECKELQKAIDTHINNTHKKITIVSSSKFKYLSDQVRFENNVGVAALKKVPVLGYYLDRIHTSRDTKFDIENSTLLTVIVIDFIIRI